MQTTVVSLIEVLKTGGSLLSVLLNIVVLWKLSDMARTIDVLSRGKRWTETCDEKHKGLNDRMAALEERVETLWNKVYG